MQDQLINNVSDTALWIAAFRALESERPDAAFKDGWKVHDNIHLPDEGDRIGRKMPTLKFPYNFIISLFAVREITMFFPYETPARTISDSDQYNRYPGDIPDMSRR